MGRTAYIGAGLVALAAVVVVGGLQVFQGRSPLGLKVEAEHSMPGPPALSAWSEGSLPAEAVALAPGDLGIEPTAGGSLVGRLRALGMRCDHSNALRIETDQGSYLVELPTTVGMDCEGVLGLWRRQAPADTAVGLRYSVADGRGQLIVVNDTGVSMTVVAVGAWRVP